MALQFRPYEDPRPTGAEYAQQWSQGIQNIGNTVAQGLQQKRAAERQALLDKFLRDKEQRDQKMFQMEQDKFKSDYGSPLDSNATIQPQASLFSNTPQGRQAQTVPVGQPTNLIQAFNEWRAKGMPKAGARGEFIPALAKDERNQFYGQGDQAWERDFKERQLASNEGLRKTIQDRNMKNQNFGNESQIRNQFLSQSKDFSDTAAAYQRIIDSAKDPSPAGDLALIFNYMKTLDPGSTVREGEFANAAASGSYGDRIQVAAQKIIAGERLSPEMRADFVERATDLYKGQLARHKQRESEFKNLGSGYGINPVLPDLSTPIGGYNNSGGLTPEEEAELRQLESEFGGQ